VVGDRQKLWRLRDQGKSINEICELMGLSHGTVQRIVQGPRCSLALRSTKVLFGTGGETDQGRFSGDRILSTTYVGFRTAYNSDGIHGGLFW
jgi:hypothetical protein